MPHPRFNKLSVQKREQIVEAAAKEFAAYGYEGASLNRILEEAGVSKGAAYYYFNDKTDVFLTVVDYYRQRVMSEASIDFATLDAETFWPTVIEFYSQQFAHFPEQPWMLAAAKASTKFPRDVRANPLLAETFRQISLWLKAFLKRGQELGVVRTDLPDDLIVALVQHIDQAGDEWIVDHWQEIDAEKVQDLQTRLIDGMRHFLMPPK
jgi:AcrR family transcriptional regulator